ncbi:tenascin-X [Corallococcus sp. bb12-1]|uniref:tenascin-X n=1 Tax=Corallococcus sp. bb12-1 TaxID=2996784 RepID=UPI002270B968|nr:tenascin-X [Corallococcus sp. bb12-1]MCY1039810.1 tenascin-X [Corallococcus sp. bb12-1]
MRMTLLVGMLSVGLLAACGGVVTADETDAQDTSASLATAEQGIRCALCDGEPCPPPNRPCCGDFICDVGDPEICPMDCPEPPGYCGDGVCNNGESSATCPGDCGAPAPYCGDGVCNNGESSATCPGDCGAPAPYCGDGVCDSNETWRNCAPDCYVSCIEQPCQG